MRQQSLATVGFELATKRTRKRQFLEEMNLIVPWREPVTLISQHVPVSKMGRPPFAVETMLRIHFMQQWFGLSDPAMEEAMHDTPVLCQFAQLDTGLSRLPDESTILRFRHFLEEHDLSQQMMATVNALLQDSGLVHTVTTTPANEHDVTQAIHLLHGQEIDVFADAGYRGVDKREEIQHQHKNVQWHVAMMPGKRRALKKTGTDEIRERIEKIKASVRAKVEHPFRDDQAPIRICENTLSRAGQKHGTVVHSLCAFESVDGEKGAHAEATHGIGAPSAPQNLPDRRRKQLELTKIGRKTQGHFHHAKCGMVGTKKSVIFQTDPSHFVLSPES